MLLNDLIRLKSEMNVNGIDYVPILFLLRSGSGYAMHALRLHAPLIRVGGRRELVKSKVCLPAMFSIVKEQEKEKREISKEGKRKRPPRKRERKPQWLRPKADRAFACSLLHEGE